MMGRMLINNKKSSFLSLKLNLNFIFFTNNQTKTKNGIIIQFALIKK